MRQISINEAQRLTSPNPFCLVTSINPDGRTNVMAVSWWTYVSNRPPKLAICLSKKSQTNANLHARGEFSVCIPAGSLAQAGIRCGACSGRDTDKAAAFGLALAPANTITPMVVRESRVIFECLVLQAVDCGDHDLFLGEVRVILGDDAEKALYSMDGYSRLSTL